MPDVADVYRRVEGSDELSSGDIAYVSLARTRAAGEGPPGEAFDPIRRIPAYPRPALHSLPHGREIALDTVLALVVTHSCEIDRQKNQDASADRYDCRLTVAPIVPEPAVALVGPDDEAEQAVSWAAIERNEPVASLYLPPVDDLSEFAPGIGLPWPRAFADLRGLATVSRRLVATDRLCGLTPSYVGMLQRQLTHFFTWRDLARHELVEAMVGRRIEAAVPLNTKADRWRVALTADDGSSLTVELRTQ
jgi:hypothetical protein